MVSKLDLEKNSLDLSYRRNLQLLTIILVSGLGGIFTYLGALILDFEKVVIYTFLMILIMVLIYIFYWKINDNLKNISEKIKTLI
ncbi:hypothetical protein CMI37_36475 [Candidatus Pacearchaeota archaeon]|nr:hypothetical protein [Candidatus Pacearchaeota archaeon]|tara:strand:- start:1296 stop:1550 length:255 start_codon:yes stop_codon:yes gene_type:complete